MRLLITKMKMNSFMIYVDATAMTTGHVKHIIGTKLATPRFFFAPSMFARLATEDTLRSNSKPNGLF
jgi:hypothetical protein